MRDGFRVYWHTIRLDIWQACLEYFKRNWNDFWRRFITVRSNTIIQRRQNNKVNNFAWWKDDSDYFLGYPWGDSDKPLAKIAYQVIMRCPYLDRNELRFEWNFHPFHASDLLLSEFFLLLNLNAPVDIFSTA